MHLENKQKNQNGKLKKFYLENKQKKPNIGILKIIFTH
jgi:hypothetical protein